MAEKFNRVEIEVSSVSLVQYLRIMKREFINGGIMVWMAFAFMQIFRICMFTLVFSFINGSTSSSELTRATVITVSIYPIEILICWKLSNVGKYYLGQLTGKF